MKIERDKKRMEKPQDGLKNREVIAKWNGVANHEAHSQWL